MVAGLGVFSELQRHRSATGTLWSTCSTWAPHPFQVGRPHFRQVTCLHIPHRVSERALLCKRPPLLRSRCWQQPALEVRSAGLLGPMGSTGNADDSSMAEGSSGALQLEMLDRRRWQTRHELALAVFS